MMTPLRSSPPSSTCSALPPAPVISWFFLSAFFLLSALLPAKAVEINITRGNLQPIPIAISPFLGATDEDKRLGQNITQVVIADLERSGLFRPIDRATFIEDITTFSQTPRFADWRIIKSQALVIGQISEDRGGRIKAEFRLWDVFSGKALFGQQFFTSAGNWRRLGHTIADAIYQRMTGEKGYFDTRIVFIDERGPKNARVKRLALMDQDGFNLRFLTSGKDLVLTPRFNPSAQEITYLSYQGGLPRVYLFNLETGERELVGDFPGMTFAPRFSPKGKHIIMSLEQEGHSNIFLMNLANRQTKRLTFTDSIDTAPSFSPDGRQIVFESDRSGNLKLYVMNADGSKIERISHGEGRYSTPVWSPRGDLIAFTKQLGSRFLIGVMHPDGSGERILSDGFHNEGPTWAPNGRVLMFFRESPGISGGAHLYTVDLTGYNERIVATPAFGSDPAWSPAGY